METSPRSPPRQPPPPDTELSILVQAFRLADPEHAEGCEERELEALEQWEDPRSRYGHEPGPPQTNAWFIITDGGAKEGIEVSEVFRNVHQDRLIHSRKQTNCFLVGSQLYDIGGVGSTLATNQYRSNIIRRLDIENPSIGWKTNTLPFYCAGATATVSGNLIYLFPGKFNFTPVSARAKEEWAYVYDTVEQKAFPIQLPSSDYCNYSTPKLCFPVDYSPDKRGIVTHLLSEDGSEKFHLLGDDSWRWKSLDNYGRKKGILSHRRNPCYAVSSSNGLLYVCERPLLPAFMYLYVYDITKPDAPLLCQINLSGLHLGLDDDDYLFLIPVSDSNICFLWSCEGYGKKPSPLYYAKVKVCIDPPPATATATLLKQVSLEVNVVGVSSCLPLSMPQGGRRRRDFQRFIGPQLRVNEIRNPQKHKAEVEDLKTFIKQLETSINRQYRKSNKRIKSLDRRSRKSCKRIKRVERIIREDRE